MDVQAALDSIAACPLGHHEAHVVLALATEVKRKGPLTAKQRRVFVFIQDTLAKRGIAPSYNEIAHHCGYNSLATVWEHLMALEKKGWLVRDAKRERAIRLLP